MSKQWVFSQNKILFPTLPRKGRGSPSNSLILVLNITDITLPLHCFLDYDRDSLPYHLWRVPGLTVLQI